MTPPEQFHRQRRHDVAEHGVDDDFGALLREAGDMGHLLDERRLRQAAVGHGLVYRRKHQARASPAGDNAVRSNDSSGKTVGAPATGTTAPPRPEATSPARPRPRTGNAGRRGRPASFADDTRPAALAVRRSAVSAAADVERERWLPLSREPRRGAGCRGFEGDAQRPLARAQCTHIG